MIYVNDHVIHFRGVLLRLMADYTNAIDELLLAMDKCHHDISSATYQNASRQLLLTINDFAVYCYRYCHTHTLNDHVILVLTGRASMLML